VNTFSVRNYGKPKPNAAYTLEGGVGFLENNESDNYQYSGMLTKTAEVLGGHQFDIGYGYNDVRYSAVRSYSGPMWAQPAAPGMEPQDVGKEVYGAFFYLYPTRAVGGTTYNNVYRMVRGNFSDPSVTTDTNYHYGFVQDAWQINRYITAKVGVRWEQQQIAGNLDQYTFAANWAPRLGFVIDPTGSRRTKLFANWGRFFEKIPQDLAVRALSEEFGYYNANFFGLPPTAANLVPGSVWSPSGTHHGHRRPLCPSHAAPCTGGRVRRDRGAVSCRCTAAVCHRQSEHRSGYLRQPDLLCGRLAKLPGRLPRGIQ
jgi:hypothetical protein